MKHGGENAALVEAAAEGEADDGRGPETGRRGQSLHALPLGNDDGARTDEADTRNNLCTEARHICKIVHIQIQILTRQRGDGRTDADEDVRAEAGRAALVRALDADDAAADERAGETHKHGKRRHARAGRQKQITYCSPLRYSSSITQRQSRLRQIGEKLRVRYFFIEADREDRSLGAAASPLLFRSISMS